MPDPSLGRFVWWWVKRPDWRCECGDLNRWYESFCYRCGAGRPDDDE